MTKNLNSKRGRSMQRHQFNNADCDQEITQKITLRMCHKVGKKTKFKDPTRKKKSEKSRKLTVGYENHHKIDKSKNESKQ